MKYNQMRQVVFPILAAFIWGTAFVAQDLCADSIGAFAFNATRYLSPCWPCWWSFSSATS